METRLDARDRINALTRGAKILLLAATLLLVDLFLSWQKQCVDTPVGDVCGSRSCWSGFWGVVLGLLTLLLLAWVALQIANVDLSSVNLPVSDAMITLGLGVLVLAAAIIKLLTIIGDASAWPAYVGVLLAAAAAYGAWLRSREVDDMAPRSAGGTSRPADAPAGTGDTGRAATSDPATGTTGSTMGTAGATATGATAPGYDDAAGTSGDYASGSTTGDYGTGTADEPPLDTGDVDATPGDTSPPRT